MKTLSPQTFCQEDALFSIDDLTLLVRYRFTDDQRYLEELLHRYVPFIQRICRRFFSGADADDMCMRVLEVFLLRLEEEDIRKFASWVRILCQTECLMELRARRRRTRDLRIVSIGFEKLPSQEAPIHDCDASTRHSWRLLNIAMRELPDNQRDCLELFYYREFTYEQICHEKGMTYNQVKSHLQNGRRNLRNRLSSHPCFIERTKRRSVEQVKHG